MSFTTREALVVELAAANKTHDAHFKSYVDGRGNPFDFRASLRQCHESRQYVKQLHESLGKWDADATDNHTKENQT